MLLAGAPYPAIAKALTVRQRISCSEDAVELYAHFYWNLELIDSTEAKMILQLRVDALEEHTDRNRRAQHKAAKRAQYTDPRVIAAGLPSSPLTALLAQMRAGVMPRYVNLNEVLGRVRDAGSLRAFEAMMNGGRHEAQSAALYIQAAKVAMDMLDGLATPEAAVLDQLNKIQINSIETGVPSIQELSGGEFTVDVATEPARPKEE
jgi:hypothetical protein